MNKLPEIKSFKDSEHVLEAMMITNHCTQSKSNLAGAKNALQNVVNILNSDNSNHRINFWKKQLYFTQCAFDWGDKVYEGNKQEALYRK